MRRSSDRRAIRNSIFGAAIALVGVFFYYQDRSWLSVALILIGGVMFQGDKLVELVRVWRRGNGSAILERRKEGEEDGVEPT